MFISLTAIGIAIAIIVVVFRNKNIRGAKSLIAFAATLLIWAVACIEDLRSSNTGTVFWIALCYLCITFASTTLLTFTIEYTNRDDWLNWRTFSALVLALILIQILFWTNPWHTDLVITGKPNSISMIANSSPWYGIQATYSIGLILLAMVLTTQTFSHKSRQTLVQSATIVGGLMIPMLISVLNVGNIFPDFFTRIERTPLAFSITGLFLFICIFGIRFVDFVPIARDVVIENMSDGWMVINPQNLIVDVNRSAESIIGLPKSHIFGKPAEDVLENWPHIDLEPTSKELEYKGSVSLHGQWHFMNIRTLPLTKPLEQRIGKIILWRDITERKKADVARQKAKDEMFTLVDSISSAASEAINLHDFLVDALFQIAYSFLSDASFIYLSDQVDAGKGKPNYHLAVHHGFDAREINHLSSSPDIAKIVAWVTENNESFFVPDAHEDTRLPPEMRETSLRSLLIVPLFTDQENLGALGLIRKSGSAYGYIDLTRCRNIGERVAFHIYNNRQRQAAITNEERQRLSRDLHDSVTQKLYGLVALTEAAQAGLDGGSMTQATQVLARIGEHARQAIKEMRLFLYEMKPVNLENEGLAAVLHQRLASVEGRADIKARLITDDTIPLSLEKETALYFIAQEALNNALKHANAKSVTIHLKKKKSNIELMIEDDGCGYEKKDTDKGGMGLQNMEARAAKVGGKFKIQSIPGKGTKVIALVSRDKPAHETGGKKNE